METKMRLCAIDFDFHAHILNLSSIKVFLTWWQKTHILKKKEECSLNVSLSCLLWRCAEDDTGKLSRDRYHFGSLLASWTWNFEICWLQLQLIWCEVIRTVSRKFQSWDEGYTTLMHLLYKTLTINIAVVQFYLPHHFLIFQVCLWRIACLLQE